MTLDVKVAPPGGTPMTTESTRPLLIAVPHSLPHLPPTSRPMYAATWSRTAIVFSAM